MSWSILVSCTATSIGAARISEGEVLVWIGAGNRIRTGDPQLGKLMLYQLSYSRSERKG